MTQSCSETVSTFLMGTTWRRHETVQQECPLIYLILSLHLSLSPFLSPSLCQSIWNANYIYIVQSISISLCLESVPLWRRLFLSLRLDRHEDGTVRFWDASGVALTPIYKLSTANVFHTDCDPCDDPQDSSNDPDMQQEEEWPPFRKVRAHEFDASVTELQAPPSNHWWGLALRERIQCSCTTHLGPIHHRPAIFICFGFSKTGKPRFVSSVKGLFFSPYYKLSWMRPRWSRALSARKLINHNPEILLVFKWENMLKVKNQCIFILIDRIAISWHAAIYPGSCLVAPGQPIRL